MFWLKRLIIFVGIICFQDLLGAYISIYNHTKQKITVLIDVKGASDKTVTIDPIDNYRLDQSSGTVAGITINGKKFDCSDGQKVSYDTDLQGNPVLVPDKFGYAKPFSIIAISDTHTIGATDSEMAAWEKAQKKAGKTIDPSDLNSLPVHKEISQRIQNFIANNPAANIRSVIIPGDLVWWNDNPSVECNAFKTLYYKPISNLLNSIGGKLYACAGNHDQYGGHKTPIMNFIKDTYGQFFYTVTLHRVYFVVLGEYPTPAAEELGTLGKIAPDLIDRDAGALNFLEEKLKEVPSDIPVVVIMHMGTQKVSPWWDADINEHIGYVHPLWSDSKVNNETDKVLTNVMNRFYKALEGHTVLGVICGHVHKQKVRTTSNGKYQEIIIGSKTNPAFFTFDASQKAITVLKSINQDGQLVSF